MKNFLDFVRDRWILFAVLGLAVFLRLIYYMGVMRGDDFRYAYYAYQAFNGGLEVSQHYPGINRPGLYMPAGFLASLLGFSEFTVILYSLLASLIAILFVYKILSMLAGKDAALIGAFLWSVFPLSIFMATQLDPEGPLAMLSLGAIYFFLKGNREIRYTPKLILYLVCAGLVWWAMLTKLSIVPILFVLAALSLLEYWEALIKTLHSTMWVRYVFWAALVMLGAGLLFAGFTAVSRQSLPVILNNLELTAYDVLPTWINGRTNPLMMTDLGGNWAFNRDFVVVPPIEESLLTNVQERLHSFDPFISFFLIATAYAFYKRDQKFYVPLVWLATLLLYLEWGHFPRHFRLSSILAYTPLTHWVAEDNFLYIAAPMIMVVAIYLSQLLKDRSRRSLMLGIVFVLVSAIFLENLAMREIVLGFLGVCLVFVTVIAFASPFSLLRRQTQVWSVFIAVVPLIGMAALTPTKHYHVWDYSKEAELRTNLQQAIRFLDENPDLPVFASGPVRRLDFYSGFRFGYPVLPKPYDYPDTRFTDDPTLIQDVGGYFVSSGCGSPIDKLADWPIAQFGQSDSSECISIVRSLPEEAAQEQLVKAKKLLYTENPQTLREYLSAAANANNSEEFVAALVLLNSSAPEGFLSYQAAPVIEEYVRAYSELSKNLLASFTTGGDIVWEFSDDLTPSVIIEDGNEVVSVEIDNKTDDIQTIVMEMHLRPGTAYLLEVEMKASAPFDLVRFAPSNIPDSYLDSWDRRLEWTTYSIVFVTPNWVTSERNVSLELARIFDRGSIWFRQVNLIEGPGQD